MLKGNEIMNGLRTYLTLQRLSTPSLKRNQSTGNENVTCKPMLRLCGSMWMRPLLHWLLPVLALTLLLSACAAPGIPTLQPKPVEPPSIPPPPKVLMLEPSPCSGSCISSLTVLRNMQREKLTGLPPN